MHKTYTDCYKMQGFVGGEWAYSLNANHPDGVPLSDITNALEQDERRLALYFLGWESIEVCLPFPNLRNLWEIIGYTAYLIYSCIKMHV